MKWFTFLGIFLTAVTLVFAAPSLEDVASPVAVVVAPKGDVGAPRNWLTDLIRAILGIGVSELLTMIDEALKGLDRLVNLAVSQLDQILGSVNDDIKREITEVINNALLQALIIVRPILIQLGRVIPAISGINPIQFNGVDENNVQDIISDIIEAILGISLEELLMNAGAVLVQMDQLLADTLNRLKLIAVHAPEIADRINQISDDCVIESQELITPVLNKLHQILPIRLGIEH